MGNGTAQKLQTVRPRQTARLQAFPARDHAIAPASSAMRSTTIQYYKLLKNRTARYPGYR